MDLMIKKSHCKYFLYSRNVFYSMNCVDSDFCYSNTIKIGEIHFHTQVKLTFITKWKVKIYSNLPGLGPLNFSKAQDSLVTNFHIEYWISSSYLTQTHNTHILLSLFLSTPIFTWCLKNWIRSWSEKDSPLWIPFKRV